MKLEEAVKHVENCYLEILKRPVDPEGKVHYATSICDGVIKAENLPNILRGSREYKEKFRNQTDFKNVLVVVPVRKADRWLPAFRASFENLNWPRDKLYFAFSVAPVSDDSYGQVSQFKKTFKNVWMESFTLPGHNRFGILAQTRNRIIQQTLKEQEYVLSIDSDIVQFPSDMLDRLMAHDVDIVAPLVVIEEQKRFYDILAFSYQGKKFAHAPPYCPACKENKLFEVDSVGTCYLVKREVFDANVKYATEEDMSEQIIFCRKAREKGFKIWVDPTITVTHAYLPKYGETFH